MQVIFLDIETTGLDPLSCDIVTVQLLTESGELIIMQDPESLEHLKSKLENNLIVGHNLKFDLKFLKHRFGITPQAVYDTYLAEIVLSGGVYVGKKDTVGLKDLVLRYCGKHLDKTEQTGFQKGASLTPAQVEYCLNDLQFLPEIVKQQRAKIKLKGLERTIDIEMKALPAIIWLELSGICVDTHRLSELQALIKIRKSEAEEKLYKAFGTTEINLNSTKQLKTVLNSIGIPVKNTAAEELAKHDSPVIKILLEYKEAEKLLNSFVEKLSEYINGNTGRVHADFFQIGAKSGRLSCKNPNLQQQPSKVLPEWRTVFKAGPGNVFVIADYSQIELRIIAQVSQDPEYIKAFNEGSDLHKLTASKVFGKPLNAVGKEERSIAKTVNFGIAYGMWSLGLQKKLQTSGIEITENEAESIIKTFYDSYPGVSKYLSTASTKALATFELTNLAGRLIKFERPADENEKRRIKREAKNLPIQSLCADMVKIAMHAIYTELEPQAVQFVNTVHDELVFECTEAQAARVKEVVNTEMKRAAALFLKDVPCVVDIAVSSTWEK
ncbi:MAG TPA: DNA polymerase [Methanosarcina sp.]|nr:DNA polymerase [Methanosarcina sp.]